MVRAILEGRKTQTRRVVTQKDALEWLRPGMFTSEFVASKENGLSPLGYAGDRLYVRETWAAPWDYDNSKPSEINISDGLKVWFRADGDWPRGDNETAARNGCGRWRPSIHMPKTASRIWLEVVDIRVERIRDISERNAVAVGLYNTADHTFPMWTAGEGYKEHFEFPRSAFIELWDSLNEKRGFGFETNPWVWAVAFKRVQI